MQLVAYGVQDVYLTGNPQITFFKVVYRRHTNFAVEPIEQTFQGNADFGKTVTAQINRNADLITKMYVKIDIPRTTDTTKAEYGWVRRLGHAMIDEVRMSIGGTTIEKQYGDWLNIWYELTHSTGHERGYSKMIGDVSELTNLSRTKNEYTMYLPLQFWFCRNNGLALPLIALQYHDTRVEIKFRRLEELIIWRSPDGFSGSNGPRTDLTMGDALLLVDYVYLDAEERKKFAQAAHEYLIDVVQFTGDESASSANEKFKLAFNHPSKALYWSIKLSRYSEGECFLEWATDSDEASWEKARENFAKKIWLATRSGLRWDDSKYYTAKDTDAPETRFGDTSSDNKERTLGWYIMLDKDHGEITKPIQRGGLSERLATLASLVDGQLIFASGQDNDSNLLAPAVLTNVVLTRNNITAAHLSMPISKIVFPTDATNSATSGVSSTATGTGIPVGSDNPDAANTGVSTNRDTRGFVSPKAFVTDMSYVARDHFNYGLYINREENPVLKAKLQLNSLDRFSTRDGNYFNYVQPWQHHSRTPADGINVYSFALNPEEHQPSGTANFSRIDNTTLIVELGERGAEKGAQFTSEWLDNGAVAKVYATNYNVLRIMSGMGGLAYSN